MLEYKMTRQAVDMDWAPVQGAAARELELHPPSGEDWALHSFEHSEARVVAVWSREKRPHTMSDAYAHPDSPSTGHTKTIADMPVPR